MNDITQFIIGSQGSGGGLIAITLHVLNSIFFITGMYKYSQLKGSETDYYSKDRVLSAYYSEWNIPFRESVYRVLYVQMIGLGWALVTGLIFLNQYLMHSAFYVYGGIPTLLVYLLFVLFIVTLWYIFFLDSRKKLKINEVENKLSN